MEKTQTVDDKTHCWCDRRRRKGGGGRRGGRGVFTLLSSVNDIILIFLSVFPESQRLREEKKTEGSLVNTYIHIHTYISIYI